MSAPTLTVVPEPGQSRYAALAAALRARVVAGEWPPGSALPAEQTLAAEHGVALGTLRRALELLATADMKAAIHAQGAEVQNMTPDQFSSLLKTDYTKWKSIVQASGATIE